MVWERVYRDGAADNAVFAQQLARWQRDHGDAEGLAEFAAVVAELAPAYTRVLELVAARRGDTIEALHAKSDLQVGMEALLGGSVETGADGRDAVAGDIFDVRRWCST
jgi:hypothetical protein